MGPGATWDPLGRTAEEVSPWSFPLTRAPPSASRRPGQGGAGALDPRIGATTRPPRWRVAGNGQRLGVTLCQGHQLASAGNNPQVLTIAPGRHAQCLGRQCLVAWADRSSTGGRADVSSTHDELTVVAGRSPTLTVDAQPSCRILEGDPVIRRVAGGTRANRDPPWPRAWYPWRVHCRGGRAVRSVRCLTHGRRPAMRLSHLGDVGLGQTAACRKPRSLRTAGPRATIGQ